MPDPVQTATPSAATGERGQAQVPNPSPSRGGVSDDSSPVLAIRGRLFDYPEQGNGYRYVPDGIVAIGTNGRIVASGPADLVAPSLPPDLPTDRYPDKLISPGFIDAHIHLPQTRVIASYGTQLLEWLERYTFVEEQKYADPEVARTGAAFFLDELVRNGTTTAAVYGSVHPGAIDAMFAAAETRGLSMMGGKSMMDRLAPAALMDTAESSYLETKTLIERWHRKSRMRYAVTVRFAVTSTKEQMEAAAALMREFPDVTMQTHLSENEDELKYVASLYPDARDYVDVYDRFGLLSPRSLFGHCIHLGEPEMARLSETGSVAVHCPTSNLFIGSGLCDLKELKCADRPIRLGVATDVGGGTSYSMLRTLGEAYKVAQLKKYSLSPATAFRMATRDNAQALGMDDEIGSLEVGRYADIAVLDVCSTPAMTHRMEAAPGDLEQELFTLMTLGDDRAIAATYARGRRIWTS